VENAFPEEKAIIVPEPRGTSAPPALFRRPAPMGVALPSVAAGPRRLGNRQTGDGGQMASQGLSDLLAVAIPLSRRPKTSAEIRALIRRMSAPIRSGVRLASTANCSSSASR
jgi:hypothetical protein